MHMSMGTERQAGDPCPRSPVVAMVDEKSMLFMDPKIKNPCQLAS
jgi:hypothetical protein